MLKECNFILLLVNIQKACLAVTLSSRKTFQNKVCSPIENTKYMSNICFPQNVLYTLTIDEQITRTGGHTNHNFMLHVL